MTAHFGKWHLGQNRDEYLPIAQGYDASATHVMTQPQTYWDPFFRVNDGPENQITEHVTRITTDFVLDFIDANQGSPFFASVWYFAPHAPLEPPADWASRYENTANGRYAALISDADQQIGEIVDAIDALGLGEETLVLVTSDNGSERAALGSNGIYRGSKADVYEGGIRAPLFARWTGSIAPGLTNDSLSTTFDFFPTLAGYLGVDTSGLGLEGVDLQAALLSNQTVPRIGPLVWETKDATTFFTPLDDELNRFAVRKGNWKLVRQDNAVNAAPSLFDIATDPKESTDVAAANPGVVQDLLQDYRDWRARVSVIDYDIDLVIGRVSGVTRGRYRFRGGRLDLARDARFDFNDGDFSFQARIKRGKNKESVIAELPGGWRLSSKGSTLTLAMQGPSATTTLTASLPRGRSHVAFTVFGWRFSESTVRLYVGGALQDETNQIMELSPNEGTILLGNDADMTAPYTGRLSRVRLHAQALTPAEVAAAAQ